MKTAEATSTTYMIIGDVGRERVWSVYFPHSDDALMAALWERGTYGIEEQDGGGWRAYFSGHDAYATVLTLAGCRAGQDIREEIEGNIPAEVGAAEPILVGDRFYIGPSAETPDGRLTLQINSGIGFGTGRHETTQLCLSALERVLHSGDRVLDVGCGSGILGLAARLLGASFVVSCDIFEDVTAAARQNARTLVFAGSADGVADHTFDLVLANLTGAVLDRLAFDLKRVTKPEGRLLISGFLQQTPPRYYTPDQMTEQADWQCWTCRPAQIAAPEVTNSEDGLTHVAEWWL